MPELRAHRAVGSLARARLEAVAKDKKITTGTLHAKITALAAGGHLRPHTAEVAHEIRHLGNTMAHGDFTDPVDADEAATTVELMSEVLQEVYQKPRPRRPRPPSTRSQEDHRPDPGHVDHPAARPGQDHGEGSSTLARRLGSQVSADARLRPPARSRPSTWPGDPRSPRRACAGAPSWALRLTGSVGARGRRAGSASPPPSRPEETTPPGRPLRCPGAPEVILPPMELAQGSSGPRPLPRPDGAVWLRLA